MDDERIETETQRLTKEFIDYAESLRESKYEPFYSIANRIMGRAKAFDKRVKQ